MTDTTLPPSRSFTIAPGSTIADALRGAPLSALEARILLGHALQLTRVQLITQSQRVLGADECARIAALFQRRLDGEPIAYIVGEREFYGLTLYTTTDVLIPRPETELLVELALERAADNARVLDLGTGSGAIAIAIAYALPEAQITAIDSSAGALAVAQRNAARHGVNVDFLQSDWYEAVAGRRFDIIVSNPPYIVAGDPHLSQGDLRFEPVGALTDHADGLSALRKIVDGAPRNLVPGGWLLMEHGYDQAHAVRSLLAAHGFQDVQSWKDLAGIERVSGGRL
ncbi:peptide chain release factor N(5)-glutamine methyltransferase [Noviherbaspirillum sp. UKPF54]|uniref:peptide chain release factor N(5)-glutamine methyltransferase n=1 Tax=Noviherbaspirillum sp. UKPF54 TaxID=2601898 RepID=UPI0011B14985|nr:peptide chain release factor N(5)-glutamine methyltransferase [Noviherbaspirillum sp. UKPF54]QDZ30247.1 peptide chain release factor N(5)-glutamine methyltransferase [Noviherbaspirillum sp. UKPF54]